MTYKPQSRVLWFSLTIDTRVSQSGRGRVEEPKSESVSVRLKVEDLEAEEGLRLRESQRRIEKLKTEEGVRELQKRIEKLKRGEGGADKRKEES